MNLPGLDHAGLFDASPNPYLVLDRQLNIAGANKAYLASTKRELADIVGRWAWEAFPTDPDTEAKAIASFQKVIATRQADTMPLLRFDVPRPAAEGGGFEERWWSLVHSPIFDVEGEVAFILQDAKDVTETQLAKAALRVSETQAEDVLEGMGEGFLLLGPDFRIRRINAEGLRIDGRPAAEILGRHMLEVWPEAENFPTWPLYQRAMAHRQPGQVTYQHAAGGHDVWLEVRVSPAGDGLAIFYVDVSTEQRMQKELRESEARLRRALDIETVGAIFFDLEGRITDANDAFLRMAGYGREDIQAGALTWHKLTPPDGVADLERAFGELMAAGVTTPYEKEYLRSDGSRWWGLFSARLLPESMGFKLIVDVTEARLERARRETLTRLSDRLLDLEDPNDIAYAAAEATGTALGAKHAGYAPIDATTGSVASGDDWTDPGAPTIVTNLPFTRLGAIVDALRRGDVVAIPDVRIEERLRDSAARLEARHGRSLAIVPVMERGKLAAVFFVKDNVPRHWPPEDLAMIREVAQRTRTAVERARQATARREAEAALRRANETLETRVAERTAERDRTWRLSRDLMVVVRTDGMLRAVNPAWSSILGYEPEEVVGRSFLEFVWPGDEPQALQDLKTALSTPDPTQIEMRYRHKGGHLRWISWLTSIEGEHIYANGRDITEEKAQQARLAATEAARREADALYRAYFQNSPETLFVVAVLPDGGFSIKDANPAHEATVGLRAAGTLGLRLEKQIPPHLVEQISTNYRRVVTSGTVERYLEEIPFGGRRLYIETVLVPIRDTEGRVTRLMGSSRDMTAQMEAEERLRQSQKLESMGQLTGGVAHDFNNLLTPIMTTLDRLQWKKIGDPVDQRLIDGALHSAERARTLVQRLLAFARKQPLQPQPVDVEGLVRGMADLVASTAGPQIHVGVEIAPGLRPARADANQLELAILNLAINARDAMPGGGELRLSVANTHVEAGHPSGAQPGAYVRVAVADTGTGMDEATRQRAIEPFFSTKGVGRGTGLGLSMAHGLAAQLGGALTITSRLGVGTIVELWLPEAEAAVDQPPAPAAHPPESQATIGTALLVDDEELVRAAAALTLSDLGYAVIEATSAEEALRLLEGGLTPDLVVTDHLMPGMSGCDLLRLLRVRQPELPGLLMSGYADLAGVAAELPRITKPFRGSELAAAIKRLMGTTGA